MKLLTFAEYVAAREGVSWPSRPPLKGLPRINTTPCSNDRRKRMAAKPKPAPDYFAPTVRAVVQVVPRHLIPKFKGGEWWVGWNPGERDLTRPRRSVAPPVL